MTTSRSGLTFALAVLLVLVSSTALAQWVEFVEESAVRISSAPELGLGDTTEKDYAWGDVDNDGDTDLVVARKEPFTSEGKFPNVLFLNQNGVLTDRTSDFASASTVPGDEGFLTPTNDRDIILVDLDLDGYLDAVTATTISDDDTKAIGHPRIYMNLGCSTPGLTCSTAQWQGLRYEETRIPTMLSHGGGPGFNPRFCSVSAGDLTGDGYPELYFGDYDSSGAGGSSQPPGADFNDKLLINGGAASPAYFTDVTPDPMRFQGTPPGISQGFEESAFGAANAIVDMNDDNVRDIVKQTSLSSPTYVGVAFNDSTPTLAFFDTYEVVNQQSPYFVSAGHLNDDDLTDLVISDDGPDRYILNQGGGFLPDFISFGFAFLHNGPGSSASDDGFGSNSVIRDLDRDGKNDVIITDVDVDIGPCFSGRRTHIYRNQGGGDNTVLQEVTEGSACENFQGNPASCLVATIPADMLEGVHDIAVFDVTGDGWDDLVVGRCDTTEVYRNVPPGNPVGIVEQLEPSAQLRIGKFGEQLTLNWGDSCVSGDTDYSIFEGRIAPPFAEYEALTCSTGGATISNITPSTTSSFYLIVPNNGTFEGGYGISSQGVPRRQGDGACFAQNMAPCDN
jgi:hypothetical protein